MDNQVKHYHFIGIGGIGMSALARILLDKKIPVSGSDLTTSQNISDLKEKGAVIRQGHSAKHVSPQHIVVFSSGIKEGNPEFMAAKALNCPMMHRSQLLADLMRGFRTFACAGTHGKTTTSSLLTAVLAEGGLDPTFAVGGMVKGINGRLGQGNFFVAEADESDGSFLNYHPEGAIITNIEPEHMDHFKTMERLYEAFGKFAQQVQNSQLLFYWGDDLELSKIMKSKGVAYGFSAHCPLRLSNYRQEGWKSCFDLSFEGCLYKDVEAALLGEHNALNAAAVFGLALRLGIEEKQIRSALAAFPGIGRRCQKRGEKGGVLFLDDYAHHPTEISKTLKSVKMAVEERRLVVLFQPHRFTRTRDQLEAFGRAFEMADLVYVDEIYAAGEEPIDGVTADRLVEEINTVSTVPCFKWSEAGPLMPHDVFITVGAGDITHIHGTLPPPRKLTVGIVFGGLSCEHEISLRSARFVASSLDQNLYDVRYFGIDKQGNWLTGCEAKEILETRPVVESPRCRPIFDVVKELEACDLFLPILHGTYGEDGTLQGFFEILGKPYIGPDYRSAALSMDKVLTKRIVASFGVPVPEDISFGHIQWQREKAAILAKIDRFPVYVKPVHLGSSVGVSCVESKERLELAIEQAFRYDTQVMIEEGKIGCRELEFAVMGNTSGFRVVAPGPGEKLAGGVFVDYEKKYLNPIQTTLHPDLDPKLLEEGKILAQKAYRAVGCSGMTRVDFLLDKEGNYWFFEMNPIPGLQQFSLFPKIWKRDGVEAEKLFDRLIILALQRKRQQDRHFKCLESC